MKVERAHWLMQDLRNVVVSLRCQKSSARVRFLISNKSAQAQFLVFCSIVQSISRAAVLRGPESKPRVTPFQWARTDNLAQASYLAQTRISSSHLGDEVSPERETLSPEREFSA
ncbi:hypothetical protein DEO72_LG10g2639 [Vigna unguiculata]|uniref:Uncharacterized protein n=1 Tax=Vigna unguiculata TaxID=3917 RepID=A0A4D6NCF8_VIGUN|nr:hypothetical protein DEO72_LG10g2639 [Vigna unguiculata]